MDHPIKESNWFDNSAYPFQSRFFQSDEGKLHYIDEGKGDVLLFVHGTPVWSFVYRHLIRECAKTHRCIAIDHLGFGLSDHPVEADYRPQAHSERLKALVRHLNLSDITIVVHDFGGPIGLGAAMDMPGKIRRVVLMNTWLWATKDDPDAQRVDRLLNGAIGRFMYLQLNASPRFLIPQAFANKKRLTKSIHQHYRKVFPTAGSRHGALEIGKTLLGASDWYEDLGRRFTKLKSRPFLIMWGEKDPFIKGDALEKWELMLPNAQVHRFPVGHFVQEEAAEDVSRTLLGWLHQTERVRA